MAKKFSEQHLNPDHNMNPWCWLNTDSQTHVFKSFLEKKYPGLRETQPQFTVPPGKLAFFPHSYYTVHTRDDSVAHGKRMTRNEATEEYSEKSFITSDNHHLGAHEKRR